MGLMGRQITETPWTVVATDIMELFPRSKSFRFRVHSRDPGLVHQVKCRALRAANGKLICEVLEDLVVSRWGTPRFLLMNNRVC